MDIPTAALFGTRIAFTVLKSLTLVVRKHLRARNLLAVLLFIIEAALGAALSVLLALNVWTSRAGPAHLFAVRLAALLILASEVLSNITEGVLLWWRCRQCLVVAAAQRKMVKNIARIVAFIGGAISLCFALYAEIASGRVKIQIIRTVALAVALGSIAIIAFLSIVLAKHARMRANLSMIVTLVGAVVAILAAIVGVHNTPEFGVPAQTATIASSLGGSLTAATAWGVSDMSATGCIDCEHARVFETVAFGVSGPALSLAFARAERQEVQQILFTVLPQAAALFLPLLLGYAATLFRTRNETPNESTSHKLGP